MPLTTRSKSKLAGSAQFLSSNDHDDDEKESLNRRRLERKRKHDECETDDDNDNNNPLLNDLVLETLFRYVKKKDLLACRLVCKKWNISSLPAVRSKLRFRIMSTGSTESISKFMKLIHSNTLGIPFQKFSLSSFDTSKGAGKQFLQLCGPTVKEIILNDTFVSPCNHYIHNISKLLGSAPQLSSFKMPPTSVKSKENKIVKLFDSAKNPKAKLPFLKFLDMGLDLEYRRQERQKICPTFYPELFEAAPNISTISLAHEFDTPNPSLEILNTIKNLGRENSIQNLKVSHVKSDHIELLQKSQWNLKQLELKADGFVNDYLLDDFSQFPGFELIEMFSHTLIALRLNFDNSHCCLPGLIRFTYQMPKLKVLELKLNGEMSLKCESFNYIFSVLEKIDVDLHLEDYDEPRIKNSNILIMNEPCEIPTLKSSFIHCHPITMQRLGRILTVFPTLQKLECTVRVEESVEVIRNIWTRMTQLEELILNGEVGTTTAVSVDSLITGIPNIVIKSRSKTGTWKSFFESLQPLDTYRRNEKICLEKNKHVSSHLRQLPSIMNLTNLRSLKLKLRGNVTGVTDVTGYFALYSLKSLQHLNVYFCELSQSCAQILVKDKNLLSWEFKGANWDFEDIIPGHNVRTVDQNQDRFPLLNL